MLYKIILLVYIFLFSSCQYCFASVKQSEFSGQFYPGTKEELSAMVDNFLIKADPSLSLDDILMLITPHAGFGYSGQTAAFGYKLIKNKSYKTVIILGTSHNKLFSGAAVYAQGSFATSLGEIQIDEEFIKRIIGKNSEIFADETIFANEHSVEVQLPFLQRTLIDFKIVPVIVGDCSLESCEKIAQLFREAIGQRKDVLVIVATDLYHGFDFQEAQKIDEFTLSLIKKLDCRALYYALREQQAQACAGFATVVGLKMAKDIGCQKADLLKSTNSAMVTGKLNQNEWTVGYASCAIKYPKGVAMLNNQQKEKLLVIARESIQTYLQTTKKLQVNETDLVLNQKMGAFVTLNLHKQLRGCIGNLVGSQPIYLTIRDMAVASAVDDPRFAALSLA
mgnify:CR=1 FL=1